MSRILLLLENPSNAELLHQLLGERYEFADHPDGFDLAIVDAASLPKYAAFLSERRSAERPDLLPVLLVTSRQNAGLFRGPLFALFDELLLPPVDKTEFYARVEMLLRARRLSLELRLRKDDLEAFIHAMTHDLRSPLMTLSGFAEALAEDQGSELSAAGKHQLDRIQGAIRQMWELIDALMEFSRLGRKAIKLKATDLDQLVSVCLMEMRREVESQNAQVRIRGPLGLAAADPALLKIAVCNLISNAVKYVAPGVTPQLEIWSEGGDRGLFLKFRDNGIGLIEEDQKRIFIPFVRLHGVEDYPGVGLGLSATRKVVEIMGGQTGVTSTPGAGSTFWIELRVGSTA